jgi:hypothetical protein
VTKKKPNGTKTGGMKNGIHSSEESPDIWEEIL